MSEEGEHVLKPKIVSQTNEENRLLLKVDVPPDSELVIDYALLDEQGNPFLRRKSKIRGKGIARKPLKVDFFKSRTRLAFLLAIVVYFLVRVIGIEVFPIYFFSDEAIQSVHAADLIRDQFYSPYGEFFPTFFTNGGQYNLGVSVYAQVLPLMLFGKAIWVTRITSVLISLLAAMGIGLFINQVLGKNWGWLAILVLSLMPAWFLHSRTAFETSMAVSFYAGFLCSYLLYRLKNPKYFYLAVVFTALAFYSYSPMRVIVAVTLFGFLISDFKYHWQHRKTGFKALIVGIALLIPFIRFSMNYPGESIRHLEILGSYWVQNIAATEKLVIFLREYISGFNPYYWFIPNQVDLQRHLMKGYGHLWQPALPFLLIGLIWCVRNFKQSYARVVFIALLAAPAGAALVGLGITRALVMVIPATLLTTIGVKTCWEWLVQKIQPMKNWLPNQFTVFGIIVFVVLSLLNIRMLVDALKNGPTWFTNYGLYGMQFGARQVFGKIEEALENDPNKDFYLTSTWTNGADVLARFFFDDPVPFEMGSIEGFITEYKPLDEDTIFIMVSEEVQRMEESGKFTNVRVNEVIPYPDGTPGFHFIQVAYVDNITEIFAAELATRRELRKGKAVLQDGEEVLVSYSALDMGEIFHIFDGDRTTLARTWEANPLRIVIEFAQPRPIEEIRFRVGGEATRIEADLMVTGNQIGLSFSQELEEEANPRYAIMVLGEQYMIDRVEVRVSNLNNDEPAHVHLWEIQFLPDR